MVIQSQLSHNIYKSMIGRTSAVCRILQSVRYNFGQWSWEQMPKPWNLPHTKQQKKMLYSKQMNPFKTYLGKFHDTLHVDGLEGETLLNLYEDFIEAKEVPLSSQNVSMLLYNFAKGNFLNQHTFSRIQPYITQNRGEYNTRSIFGGLYGCVILGKNQYLQFFIEQLAGQKVSFTDLEAVEIMQAFNISKHNYDNEFKHKFWNTHFKANYLKIITPQVKIYNYKKAMRVFNAFREFDYLQDEQIWNNILSWLDGKSGWKRTEIIEKIYPLTGTFPKAKEIFDKYYLQLSQNKHAQWRYNFEELRLYTSEEMIAKSQQNIQMSPPDRTVFKRKHQKKIHDDYHEWLKDGARQKEAELVKDKAQSLAYAIKNRYESLRKDKVDFGQLSLEQFEDLFGSYDKDMMYNPPEQKEELDENGNPIEAQKQDEMQMSPEKIKKLYSKLPEKQQDQFDLETYQEKKERWMRQKRKRQPKERKPTKKWS